MMWSNEDAQIFPLLYVKVNSIESRKISHEEPRDVLSAVQLREQAVAAAAAQVTAITILERVNLNEFSSVTNLHPVMTSPPPPKTIGDKKVQNLKISALEASKMVCLDLVKQHLCLMSLTSLKSCIRPPEQSARLF